MLGTGGFVYVLARRHHLAHHHQLIMCTYPLSLGVSPTASKRHGHCVRPHDHRRPAGHHTIFACAGWAPAAAPLRSPLVPPILLFNDAPPLSRSSTCIKISLLGCGHHHTGAPDTSPSGEPLPSSSPYVAGGRHGVLQQ
jgi:hypothetical protein